MQMRPEVKPALWGAAGGAIALALIGFAWGGWMTAAKAREVTQTASEQAVMAALAPICAVQFKGQTDAATKLDELKKIATYEQGSFIEKGGWATMPGSDKPESGVARRCVDVLLPPA